MNISARAALMAGVATVTASAVLIAPSVQPLPPPRPAIQLAANVQLTPPADYPAEFGEYLSELGEWWQPSATRAFPPPPDIGPSPMPSGFEDAIKNTYDALEPWVEWGFEIAEYAVGWIPYVGWLSGQIMIFYYFGERIVRSIVYNSADWLWGPLPFLEGLGNIAEESINALIQLGYDQWNFWIGFPLPPRPCIFGCNTLAATTSLDPEVGVTNVASDLVNAVYVPIRNGIDYGVDLFQDVLAPIPVVRIAGDQVNLLWDVLAEPIANSVVFDGINPILNAPLNINTYLNAAYNVGATTVDALIDTGFAELDYFLGGGPFLAQASVEKSTEFKPAEVGSVPEIVKDSLGGLRNGIETDAKVDRTQAGPLAELTKTVRDVRKEVRASIDEHRADRLADAGDNGVVRAKGEVRGPIAEAVKGVVNAVGGGKSDGDVEGAKAPSTTVAKSVRDTVKKVVKDAREAAKDARDSVKEGSDDGE